jgi:hypothetical protein
MREYQQTTMVDILTRSPVLANIIYKVDQLAKLNRIVLKKLDSELARHCRVSNLREGILILTTSSPTTGHLLRFSEIDLLIALRTDPAFCHLKSIKTQVRPPEPDYFPSRKVLPKPSLSSKGAEILRTTALAIASPSLKKALLRLAKHHPT